MKEKYCFHEKSKKIVVEKKNISFYLFENQRKREKGREWGRETFYVLVYSPVGHSGQDHSGQDHGNTMLVSHMGVGAQSVRPVSTAFTRPSAGSWVRNRMVGDTGWCPQRTPASP